MRKRILVMFAAVIAAFSLAGASAAAAAPRTTDFTAQAIASGLTRAEAADLQDRVDEVLTELPGGKQVSATQIRYDGLDVTVAPEGEFSTNAITCSVGYFCIDVRGTRFAFYECKKWELSNWWGDSPWNNNQTGSAVARAYAQDGSTWVWSDVANSGADSGTVDTGPWWYFRPC
ncbi:MAG TPA: hypothetical protein VGE61_01920 [Glycomyces sp.]